MKRTLITLALALSAAAPAMADLALAKAKNCMACHAVDKKLVGPSFKDVAGKYASQKDATDKLAAKILKGGGGVWGPLPMPATGCQSRAVLREPGTTTRGRPLPVTVTLICVPSAERTCIFCGLSDMTCPLWWMGGADRRSVVRRRQPT